jgi:hypothetical protein
MQKPVWLQQMMNASKPNQAELQFLNLAYNRFYDIFTEVMDDSFWIKDSWHRFSKVKDGFGVYSELLNYEPLGWVLENLKISRDSSTAVCYVAISGSFYNIYRSKFL